MKLHAAKRNGIACAAAGLLVLGIEPAQVRAWGGQGHRLVAQIAAERLTIVARQNVVWLLGPETLADVSSWADRNVDGNYQTFYWHFLNIPPDATSYDRDRDCPLQPTVVAGTRADKWRDCAVDRILYNEERLADTSLDRADRAIALKFLVHLIGDLHQPFHALGVEHGGNGIAVSVFGSETCGINPCSLHGVWDSALIAHAGLGDAAWVAKLDAQVREKGWESRPEGVPAEWAMESHGFAKAGLLPPHGVVDEAYYRAHISVIEERLAFGGLRLSKALNGILTTSPPERH
jgi:hypothetical protein